MRGSSNVGQYSSAGVNLLSSSGSYQTSNQFSRVPSFSNGPGAPFSTMSSRHAYSSNCSGSYCDEILDSYPLDTPQYLFPGEPGQNSQPLSPGYSSQQWKLIPPHPASRASQELNQESALRYGASTYYVNTSTASTAPNMTTDGSSAFPGLGSLGKSLPQHSVNRTLPNPASNKASIDSITNNIQGSAAEFSTPFGIPQSLDYKSDLSWANEHVTTGSNQGTMTSLSLSNINAPGGCSKPSSPPRLSQDNSGFGLISLSNNPLNLTASNSSDYIPALLSESTTSADPHLMLGDSPFQSSLANDNMLSNHGSTNLYSYSMGNGGRNGSITDSMASEGTLANGQVYTRLRQADSQPVPSFDPLRKGSLEISAPPQKSPICARHY